MVGGGGGGGGGARGLDKGAVFHITIQWVISISTQKGNWIKNTLEVEVIRNKCREVRFTATLFKMIRFFQKVKRNFTHCAKLTYHVCVHYIY